MKAEQKYPPRVWPNLTICRLVCLADCDDVMEPPSESLVTTLACYLRYSWPLELSFPDRVVPTGDGGVSFEWDRSFLFVSVEFACEQKAHLDVFQNGETVLVKEFQLDLRSQSSLLDLNDRSDGWPDMMDELREVIP